MLRKPLLLATAAALIISACSGDDSADPTTGPPRPIFALVDVFTALDAAEIGCADTTQANPAGLDQARAEVPVLAGVTDAGSCLYPPPGTEDIPADSLSIAVFSGERGRLMFSLPSLVTTCSVLEQGDLSYVYDDNWVLWGAQGSGDEVLAPIAAATGGSVGTADCNRMDFALGALCPNPFADVSRCDPSAAEDDFFRAALGEPTAPAVGSARDRLLDYFQTGVLTESLVEPGAEDRFENTQSGEGFAVRYPISWVVTQHVDRTDVSFVADAGNGRFPPVVNISAVDFATDLDLVDFRNAGDGQAADCISDRQILSGEAHPTTPRWFPRIAGSIAGQTLDAFVVAYTGSSEIPAGCEAARDSAPYPLPLPHDKEAEGSVDLAWLVAFVTDADIETPTDQGWVITYVAAQDDFLSHLAEVRVIFESLIFTGEPSAGASS